MPKAIIAMVLALGAPLSAATLESLTIEEMARQATAVARGRIGEARSARFGALVYTLHRFQVLEQWAGAPIADGLEVASPGGTYEGLTYRFAGAPDFEKGGEYILFLWQGPSGRTQVVGLSQGVFRVAETDEGWMALRSAAEDSSFVGGDEEPGRALETPVDSLAARVAAALEESDER